VKSLNILIASVGGQGGLTLSRVLAVAAVKMGLSVRTGETLGMAQRYGAVVSYVKIGEKVYSPLISTGDADALVGLELIETLRNTHYLKLDGVLIVADEYRPPVMASITGRIPPKKTLIEELLKRNAVVVPARKLAVEAGNPRALNMVMLGVLNAKLEIFPHKIVEEAIESILRGEAAVTSIKAYHMGYKWLRGNQT